jgi:hypothetical protein
MGHSDACSLRRLLRAGSAPAFLVLVLGCGDGSPPLRTVPVAGTVTVDGEPLRVPEGTVLFKPDRDRGNTSPYEPSGSIDENGNYRLRTEGRGGAPPGRYRVVVAAHEAPSAGNPSGMFKPTRYDPRVNRRYRDARTSTLEVEVVEQPASGAYDLNLTK